MVLVRGGCCGDMCEEVVLLVMNGISESREALSVLCCAYSLSCVQLFVTPWTAGRQAPLSMGILQARILEWVAIPSSRGSSQPRDGTWDLLHCR